MPETPSGQKLSSLGINHNPLAKAPEKETYDFFTSVLNASRELGDEYNPNDHLITMKTSLDQQKGSDITLYDPETVWEKNKGKYANNRDWFNQDYQKVTGLYDSYRKNELDYYTYSTPPSLYTKFGFKPVSGVGFVVDPKPLANYGYMNEFEFNLTPSEMAAMTGKYTDINGETKELRWQDKMNPFKNLIVDTDEKTGDYFIRETSMDEDITNEQHYSIWGSQGKYGNAILNTAGGFLSELIPGSIEMFANVQKIVEGIEESAFPLQEERDAIHMYRLAQQKGNAPAAKYYKDKIDDFATIKILQKTKKEALNNIVNFANRLKFNPSEEAQKAGWFGSMEGFMTHLGQGLSYLVPQRAITMGLGKFFTKMGTKAIMSGADDAAKALLSKYGYRLTKGEMSVVNAAGFGTGTLQAISGVYTGAKRAGLSDEEASWMSVVASPFVYITEKTVGGGWLWKELQGAPGKKELADQIMKFTKHEITSSGFSSAKQLTEKNMINISKNAISSFIGKSKDLGYKSWQFLKDKPFVGAGLREGTQESLEEQLYVTEEIIFDKIQQLQDKQTKYNTEFTSDETLKRLSESWFGGFFIGGVADVMRKGAWTKRANDQNDLISQHVIAGQTDKLKDLINDLHGKGQLGFTHIGETGVPITEDMKGKMRSVNDVNKDNLLQQVDFYDNLFKAGGLNTPEMMKAVGGDMNLVKEGMDNLLSQHSISREIGSLNGNLSNARSQGIETTQIDKDINDRNQELEKLKKAHLDLTSGKRLADSIKTSLISNLYDKAPDEFKNVPVITPQSQDEFNKDIPLEKQKEVERLKKIREEQEAVRIQSGATIADFEALDIENIDQNFIQTISKIKQMAESGILSQQDVTRLTTQIESKKAALIGSLEKTLDESEIEAIKAASDVGEGVETDLYQEQLFEKARISPALRTEVKIGDVVQKVSPSGELLDKETIVESQNEDGTFSLKETEGPVNVSELKNVTAQRELEEQTQIFNKRSASDNAFQSLAGIKSKYVDLNEAFGYNDDIFTTLLYTSKKEGDQHVPIAQILQNISGVDPVTQRDMTAEQYEEALRASPMMQLPETKQALQNIIRDLDQAFSKLLVNWNVYNRMDRKHSGLIDENTLTPEQFMQTAMYAKGLKMQAQQMLDIVDKTRMEREGRQDYFRTQDIKISHAILGFALPHLKKTDAERLDKILTEAKQKIEVIEKAAQEGKTVTAEDYIPVKREVTRAESILHTILNSDRTIAEKMIKDIRVLHAMEDRVAPYTAANELHRTTIDKQFNVGNFVTPAKLNKTGIPFQDIQTFVLMQSVNYIENLRRMDPMKFASSYKATLEELGEFDNIPSVEQENIVKHIVAFLSNPDDGLIQKTSENTQGFTLDSFLWNTLFVRGFHGTGKTTLISNIALSVFEKIHGKKPKVIAVAPSRKLAEKLADHISDNVSSVKVMTSKEFISEGSAVIGGTDIVIFDEASRYDQNALASINEIINGDKSTGNLRTLMLGDQSQMTSVKESTTRIPIEYSAERTVPVTEIFRSGIEDIWVLGESIRSVMFSLSPDFVVPPTKYTKDKSRGVYQIPTDDISVMANEIAEDLIANPDHIQNTAIITYSEKNRIDLLNMLMTNTELVLKVGKDKLESIVYHLDEGDMNAQGHEFERVYVAITPSMVSTQSEEGINFYRALLTASTRAQNYIAMLNPKGISETGPVIGLSTDTIESRKAKLEKVKKWYEGASPQGEGAVTEEEKEKNTRSDENEDDLEGKSFTEAQIIIPEDTPAPGKKPSMKGVIAKKDWKINDPVTVNFPKENPLSKFNSRPGKIMGFILDDGLIRKNYGTYEEMLEDQKKLGYTAYFEVKVSPLSKDTFSEYISVPLEALGIYTEKKSAEVTEKQPEKNQDSVSREDAQKMGIPIDASYKHRTSNKISSVTRIFKKGRSTFIVLDKNEDSPLKKSDFLKNYKKLAPQEVLTAENKPVISTSKRTSNRFLDDGVATIGLLSNQGAVNQDDPDDDYVRFKKALLAHMISRGVAPVVMTFEDYASLASAKGFSLFSNVVTFRYTNESDLLEIAKKLKVAKDFDLVKASLVGTLFQPMLPSHISSLAQSTNYLNQADVSRLLNTIADPETGISNDEEYQWAAFLIQIRQALANSGPMTVDFLGSTWGSLEYIPYSQPRIPIQDLIRTLRDKGFTVYDDNIYFSTNEKKVVKGQVQDHSQIILEVSAGPGLPRNKIYLETEKVSDTYFKKLIEHAKDLETMHGLTQADINTSDVYRFFLFNRSRIINNGKWLLPEIQNIVMTKDGVNIDTKGKIGQRASSLRMALEKMYDLFKKQDARIIDFNQLVGKQTKGGVNKLPSDGKYYTRVKDVKFPEGFIDVAKIKSALSQANQNNEQPQTKQKFGRKPMNIKKKRKGALLNNQEKRESRETVLRYYQKIFGEDFLAGRLEFRPNLTLSEDELYGMVANGKVYLEETKAGIEVHTKRHEAVHIVINYLLDPSSARDILNNAKNELAKEKGMDRSYIDNEQAEEYLAEKHETRYKGFTGILNKFMDWMRSLFSRYDAYKTDVNQLLYAIETGRFKDQPFYENEGDIVRASRKKKKSYSDRIEKFGEEDNSVDGTDNTAGVIKDMSDLSKIFEESASDENVDEKASDTIQEANNKKKKKDIYKNYNALIDIFGDNYVMNQARRYIAMHILENSNYNRNINSNPTDLVSLIKELRSVYKEMSAQTQLSEQVVDPVTGKIYTSFAEINGSNIHLLSDVQTEDFVIYKFGDDKVFNTFIKKILPNINFQSEDMDLFRKTENEMTENDGITEEDLTRYNDGLINDKNDERNPFDKMSQHVYFHMNNMRMNRYAYDKNGNRILLGYSDTYVNPVKLQLEVTNAAIDAQTPSNDFERGLNAFDRFALKIREIAKEASIKNSNYDEQTSSELSDILWTFYDTFLNDQAITYTDINGRVFVDYSHRYLQKNFRQLIQKNPEIADNIIVKSKNSSDILNSFFSVFHSLRRNSFTKLVYSPGEEQYRVDVKKYSHSPFETDRLKNEINEKTMSEIFIKTIDTGYSVNPEFSKKMLKEGEDDRYFNVQKDAVFIYRRGQNVPLLTVEYKNGKPVFEFSPEAYTGEIVNAFSQLGVDVGPRAVKYFTSNDDPLNKSQSPYTKQMLAEILGMYVFSSYSASDDAPNAIRSVVSKYYSDNGLSLDSAFRQDNPEKTTSDDSQSGRTSKTADNESYFHKPSDLFFLTETLAQAINYAYGREYANFFISGTGTRKMLLTYKAYLDIFLSRKKTDEFVSDQLKMNADEFFMKNPALRHLPYLQQGPEGFSNVESLDTGVDNLGRAKDLGKLNERELADGFVGAFVESVLKSEGRAERLVLPFHNISDKDVFRVFTVNLSKSDTDRFIEKKGDRYSVNKEILANNLFSLFTYNREVSDNSIKQWHLALVNSGFVNPSMIGAVEDFINDRGKTGALMLDIWNRVKSNPQLLQKYDNFVKMIKKRSGMVITKDFLLLSDKVDGVEHEVIMPGKAVNFNYLTDNQIRSISGASSMPELYNKFLKAVNGHVLLNNRNMEEIFNTDDVEAIYRNIKNVFEDQFVAFTDFLKSTGHQIPESINKKFISQRGTAVFRKPSLDEKGERGNLNVGANWDWNPFYEGFFFSYMINDVQLSSIFMGDYSLYKDFNDFLKRSASLEAPGQFANTADPQGIGASSKVAIFNDRKGVFRELQAYAAANNKTYKTSFNQFDGSGIMSPVFYHLLNRSMGGNIGSLGSGVLKPVYNHMGLYLKYAATPVTGQMAENSPELERLVEQSLLSEELKNHFRLGLQENIAKNIPYSQAFEMAAISTAEYVGLNGMQDRIISQFVPTTSVKSGAHSINDLEDDEFVTIDLDNRYLRIQTNLEQDVENTEVSNMNQVCAQMSVGVHNTERVNKLNEIQAAIASKYISVIEQEVKRMSDRGKKMNRRAWQKFLKSIGTDATANMGDIGFLVELLSNENSDVNIPVIRTKLKQYFGNRITQNAIKPKMNGVRHNQSPGALFKVFDTPEGIMTHADLVRRKIDPNTVQARSLKPMRIENGVVMPAEVLINYSYLKQFGIDPNMTLAEARAFIMANNPASLPAFEETLKVFVGRIPASSPASAFIAKAVGFINDVSNMIIIPDEHNILTGADNDGDQLNVYFPGISKNDNGDLWVNKLEDNSDVSNRNRILDIIFEYYADVNNFDLIYTPTELDTFRKALEDKLSEIEQRTKSYSPNTPHAFMFMSRMINEGKNMTGRFANSIKAYSFLVQADNMNKLKSPADQAPWITSLPLNADGRNRPADPSEQPRFIIEFLGKLLQASVDNSKELMLGALGVTQDNGNILSAMAIEGMSPLGAFDFFSKPHITKIFSDLYRRNRLTLYTSNDFNERFSLTDEIRQKFSFLQDDKDSHLIVPADTLLNEFDKRQDKTRKVVSDDDIPTSFNENTELIEENLRFYTEQVKNPVEAREQIVELRKQQRQDALRDIEQLLFLAHKGEAIWRLTRLVQMNTAGVPVFEYDAYQKQQDIEFILNQPLSNYFSEDPKPIDSDYWKSKKRFAGKDEMNSLVRIENSVRSAINFPEVLNNLPHIKEYLRIFNWLQNDVYPKVFSKDSAFTSSVFDKFQNKIGKNSFSYEENYRNFSNEYEKFLIALYFDQSYATPGFENLTSIIAGQDMISIATPEGRVRFGYQFPQYIYNTFIAESSQIREDWKDNKFLQRLDFPKENNGMFIELRDSTNINDDAMGALRKDFKKIQDAFPDVANQFAVYFMMKDGFVERKGSIMKVLGSSVFDEYSSFLKSFQKLTDDPDKSSITLSDGSEMTITELFDSSFLKDVLFHQQSQLQWELGAEVTEEEKPEVWKISKRVGEYKQVFIVNKSEPGVDLTIKYMSRFNPYHPGKNSFTSKPSIKQMSWDDFYKIKAGPGRWDDSAFGVKIRFKGKTSFTKGQYAHIIDGSEVLITSVNTKEGTIFVFPIANTDNTAKDLMADVDESTWKKKLLQATNTYKAIESKDKFLDTITSNSMNHFYRELAGALKASPRIETVLARGKLLWVERNHEVVLRSEAIEQGSVNAVYQRSTGNIYMIKDNITSPFEAERIFLHEVLHNFTSDVLTKDPSLLTVNEQEFVNKINKLYSEAVAANTAMKAGHDQRLRNVHEFIVDALTNPAVQEFLASIQTHTEVGPVSLWSKLMNILSEFFSGVSEKHFVSSSVLEGVVRVTGKFLTTPVSTEEMSAMYDIFGKMGSVSDEEVNKMMKQCK